MVQFRESFEGLEDRPNSPLVGGFFHAGFLDEFTFQSGLTLVDPIPNNKAQVLVGDFGRSPKGAKWDLGPNGTVTADDVPEGSAYIGLRSKGDDASIRFEFHTVAYQVSADVNAANDIGMIAYNAKGEEIAAASVTGVQAAAWRTNFISLSAKEPIQSVVFTATNLVIDQLFFSTSRPRTVEVGDGFQGPPTHLSKEPLILRGNERANELFGGKAADTIFGGKGRDKIFAGKGNDLVIGGQGRDKLWGEDGQDSFMFKRLHKVADRLKDFDPAEDTIFLAGKDFKGLAPGRLDEDQFSDGAVTKATRVHYDAETGDLAFITSGSWPRWVLLAKLDADLDMTARDILVG